MVGRGCDAHSRRRCSWRQLNESLAKALHAASHGKLVNTRQQYRRLQPCRPSSIQVEEGDHLAELLGRIASVQQQSRVVKREADHLLHTTQDVLVANAACLGQRQPVVLGHGNHIGYLEQQLATLARLALQTLRKHHGEKVWALRAQSPWQRERRQRMTLQLRHSLRTPDNGRVSARGARRKDVVLLRSARVRARCCCTSACRVTNREHHGVAQDLDQLLVEESHVARAEEADVARAGLLNGQELLLFAKWVHERLAGTSGTRARPER